MDKADIGIIGLGVMGANLALNLSDKAYRLSVYNRSAGVTAKFIERHGQGRTIWPADNLQQLVARLSRPRTILLMVTAGQAVEAVIKQLQPLLAHGDILIDGGNSNYQDSTRRCRQLASRGILFVGMGVSGGEDGARHGPSLMPGGAAAAWPVTYPLLGAVELGGLSVADAERKIAGGLKQGGFVQKPQVNISITQVRGNQVAVLGQVNRPGRFPLETFNTRVSDMLAAAGGAGPNGDDIVILSGMRNGKPFRQTIDIPALYLGETTETDTVLAGGDTIYVHRAPVFYIYGEAQRSGAYRIERGMTIMQALAQGGGPTARGSEYRLRLHRKNATGVIEKISPEMTDLVQANDVIYVRESIF